MLRPLYRWARGQVALARATSGRLTAALRGWASSAAELLEHGRLCRGPYAGPGVDRDARAEALVRLVRCGRLPKGTDLGCLASWLDELDAVAGGASAPRRVLMFATLPYWVDFLIPVGLVLAARGCDVDYAWMPYYLVDREQPDDPDVCWPSDRLLRRFPALRLHPRFRLFNLLHVEPAAADDDVRRTARACSAIDPPYIVRRELFAVEADPEARRLFEFRTVKNLDCMLRLRTLLRRRRYDTLLVPHGGVYEFGAAHAAGRMHGVRCVSFDVCERKGRIIAATDVPCAQLDTTPEWEAAAPHVLTPERKRVAAGYLMRREQPNWQDDQYTWQGQLVGDQSHEQLRSSLRLSPDRPVALLCTNVAWDAAMMASKRAFRSMAEWVLATVEWFTRRPDWHLVVRCHPGEITLSSNEPVPEMIAERFPNLPDNVRVVRPGDAVNTYSLMRLARFGLVYASTTGLEMAARGIPVIVAGRIHYIGKGFTTDPSTADDYFAALAAATAADGPRRLGAREVELALLYAYVYFETVPKPFPWRNVGQTDEEMQAWPLERILRGDCPKEFLDTFDMLAGVPVSPAARRAA